MQQRLSEDLIAISTLLMTAKERGEVIRLAGELNTVIEKAMEIEKAGTATFPQEKKKTLSASIKFTKEEINKMSKTFKKEFIANGCVAHIIKRPSGKSGCYYEIRYRRNGYNITVSDKDLKTAKQLFIEATKNLQSPEALAQNRQKFGVITGEWLEFKKGKIAFQTWQGYNSFAQKFFTAELCEQPIKEIRTVDLDRFMRQFEGNPRGYEDMRTLLNSIFKYAIASGIILHNPVTLVPFKRAERKKRNRMTDLQIYSFLKRLKEPKFAPVRQLAYVLYFFGLRPCEIDEETHFENGFLICRNRKRKNGKIEYKKIPVPKQAQGLIDFDKPVKPSLSYDRWLDIMKEALGEGLTPYNLRHTFASVCSETVRPDVVDVWMGDSSERLVGRVYVHFKDDFMREQMDKVNFLVCH
ncbi:MAG: hypothetical protein K2L42_03090 [Clostridia bacterium]|nr:hypothetical protein [Clostridia bacterium]